MMDSFINNSKKLISIWSILINSWVIVILVWVIIVNSGIWLNGIPFGLSQPINPKHNTVSATEIIFLNIFNLLFLNLKKKNKIQDIFLDYNSAF